MRYLVLFVSLVATPLFAKEIAVKDVALLPPVDVWFLGELHDNPWHHETQAALVEAIAPGAVVFEMLTPEKAKALPRKVLGDQAALSGALDWDNSGWPDFKMYYPIFQALGPAEVYGAQVTRDTLRETIMGGDVVEIFGSDAADFGLTQGLPAAEQALREAEQLVAHCNALPEEMLPGMVLGQRMRDAELARQIQHAFFETGGPVVVITGNGHARQDWGAPGLLLDMLTKRSIAQFEQTPDGLVPYDYYIVAPATTRDDPCLAFKKG